MKKILIYCVILCTTMVFGQEKFSIHGTISDQSNGELLYGATVYIQGTSFGTTTNEYGFYSISVPKGNCILVVSFIGFKDLHRQLEIKQGLQLDFEIYSNENQLDEVVITANGSGITNIKRPQMSVVKLQAATIKQIPAVLGEIDVIKTIQMLPGVTNNGEGSAGFNVRGGAVDQNLVLLDEAIIYNTAHFFGLFSVFNNDAIKDVKLYKGDIPAKFGGRIASVLDVRQKEGNSKHFALSGGIGLISSRLSIEAPMYNGKGSFLLAGRATYAQIFMKKMDKLKDNELSFYDLNLKTNYRINDQNKLYFSSYYGRDIFNINNTLENNYGNTSANLRWNHIFNDKLFSNLSVIYSKYDYQFKLDFIKLDWVSDIENYNVKYDLRYYLSDEIKLDFGASIIKYNINPGAIKPTAKDSPINALALDKKRATESAVYLSAEHELSPKLTAQYGLRASFFNRLGGQSMSIYQNNLPVIYNASLGIYQSTTPTGEQSYDKNSSIKKFGNIEPRLGLSYQLTNRSSLKGSYTRSVQYLHLLSNTSTVTSLDVWTTSGLYIKPQISDQFAIGFYKEFSNQDYTIELESYFKTTENRIDYIDGSDLIGNNNIETEILNGEARAYGLEFLLRKNKGAFTGWIAYTLSKSEQRTLGGLAGGPGINNGNWYNTAYDRTHDISITAAYKKNDRWSFSANAVYQTGRPVTYPNAQYQYGGLSITSYSDRNSNRLPAYHRMDLSATYTPSKNLNRRWQGEWVYGIYNVYNRKNAASITFGETGPGGINEATKTTIFGIMPSITYNFKF
ncbi:MAG: hypothetical protein COB98_05570 [Flavobacteriaceae bacterium]|nr:MAG: hypothetical protein COB98_05570 [Flavobacteriaceae bacterium]